MGNRLFTGHTFVLSTFRIHETARWNQKNNRKGGFFHNFVIDKINNIARYNLIDTKYGQMALRLAKRRCSLALFGKQTKLSGDHQRETTHEICCLAAELLFLFINNVQSVRLQIAVLFYHPSPWIVLGQT